MQIGDSLVLGVVWLVMISSPAASAIGSEAQGSAYQSVPQQTVRVPRPSPPGMVWVPAGEFTRGWDGSEGRPDERPAHRVRVNGFWIDTTEVTNAQFRAFVNATGYVTTAERPVDWEEMKKQVPPDTPKPPDEVLAPFDQRGE